MFRVAIRGDGPWLWLVPVTLCLLGCGGRSSMYHQAWASLPPDPCAQLELRVAEAGQAESLAQQAERRLRNDIQQGASADVLERDLDRLDVAASDLHRRVLAARDVTGRCGDKTRLAEKIDALERRSSLWLEVVRQARQSPPTDRPARLAQLLSDGESEVSK